MRAGQKGFTLIELLIVVVIIGILAAIAIPKFASTKEKAYITSMKADLKNLSTSQEAYFSGNNTYAVDLTALGTSYSSSTGVTVTIGTTTASTWQATAGSANTSKTCWIAMLNAGVSTDGTPQCN